MRRLPGLLTSLALATVAVAALAPPARADLLISVDKTRQSMTVIVDGAPRYIWPVSTGRPGYNTPSGEFKPFRMDKDHYSQEWDNAPMPYSIFFTLHGDAIHGTDEAKYIGRAVSHGCVRLSVAHAALLWELVKAEGMANTKVVLTGHIPGAGVVEARRESAAPDDGADVTGSIAPADEGADVSGSMAPPGAGWHAYAQGGRIYFYRDGPQEVERVDRPRRYYWREPWDGQ
jgi:L,D-transpeptidase catalytic domain